MASRVLQLIILFTVGLLVGRIKGVELGLVLSVEPQDLIVSRNKPALLPCSSATPNTTYLWTLDNKPLVDNNRIQVLANGSLFFRKVYHKKGQSDQGVYRCIVRSPLGALVSRPAHLGFASMSHESLANNHTVRVTEGDPAWLPCYIDSVPAADISWEKDTLPLPQTNRHFILDNGTLIINQAQKQDQGHYRCTARNSLVNKTRVSEAAVLSVEERVTPSPLEIVSPSLLTVNWTQGHSVNLPCVARGSPTPQVKWTKVQPDQSSLLVTNVTDGVNVLTIHNVTTDHAGVYICVASHDASDKNTISVTKEVAVQQIFYPPVITKLPLSQELPASKTVRFQCEAGGNPIPEIVWFKNGQKLHINGRIKLRTGELVLSNTVSDDSGVYQCIASNSAGVAWAAGRLVVNVSRDPPRPPSHLTCSPRSASAVDLTWRQETTTRLQAFTIHYLPTDGGEERMTVKQMVPDVVNQTLTVDKLPAYTNFTFYVRSYSSNAASDTSEEVVCRTGESVPIGVPVMSVRSQSAMTVLVEWAPLPASIARGQVSEHKVQWRRRTYPSTHVDIVPGDVTRYVITSLRPETQYEVRVLAATAKGWPSLPESEMPWSQVTTPSRNAPALLPPPIVQLTVINATTIQVRWTLVPDSVHIEGFRLSYRKHNSQPSEALQLPANTTEYLLLGLEPQTWYEVQVKGVSGPVEGEMGVGTIHTLPPLHETALAPALAPPTNVEATPTSPRSIQVTWDSPAPPDNASYFTVSYMVVSSGVREDNNNTNFLHSTNCAVQVTGLKPFTLYQLKVRTHDHNNRHSEFSQTLECQTLEDVPGQVKEVQWKPLNSSSVRVIWKEPNVTNGVLTGYQVSTSRQPVSHWTHISTQGKRTMADITGLTPNVRYGLVVRAATGAGLGSPSDVVEVLIPAREKPHINLTPTPPPPPQHKDQFLGVVLGCAIGGCCVVLCMVTLLYRRKCAKPHGQCRSPNTTNGAPCFHAPPDHHEMQCLPSHLDTKGGQPNCEVNGLKMPLLSNGRLPNGVMGRERNVRITENPQFECGVTVSCEELRQPSEEGDSLLSGHSLNDTQLTTVTTTPAATDKHEPDDGFHESHQPVLGPNG